MYRSISKITLVVHCIHKAQTEPSATAIREALIATKEKVFA